MTAENNGRIRAAVVVAVVMMLINVGVILYAAGRNDGGVEGRLAAIENRLERIERLLDRPRVAP